VEPPQHVAVIMDGNGRWATRRHLPRVAGHSRGVDAVRSTIEACGKAGVHYLTLFAFSSENWRRPQDEVSTLMRLFVSALQKEFSPQRDCSRANQPHTLQGINPINTEYHRFTPCYLRNLVPDPRT